MITKAEFTAVFQAAKKRYKTIVITSWTLDSPCRITLTRPQTDTLPEKAIVVSLDIEAEDATVKNLEDMIKWQMIEFEKEKVDAEISG